MSAQVGCPMKPRAARQILKDYVDGKIPHFELPSKTTTTSTDAKENNLMAMEEQNTSTDESDACESEEQDSASIGPRETKLEHVLDDLESFELASAAVAKKTGAASKTKPQASKGKFHKKPQRKKDRSWRVWNDNGDGMPVVRVFKSLL
ncbi:hypothetical protein HPP92_017736 [Vanilla planifolia]|uniref:Uncharacterized protein n=1 Tax=Vanilla planifolia TaxID=51239 RepID=A0A835Q8L4_VANPL|nr:hypothetical protein HPP92_017736 [Vanilla planifolia]